MSTYLHDCKATEGALEVSIDPQNEFIDHSTKFMDKLNKKFLRVTCPAPKISSVNKIWKSNII